MLLRLSALILPALLPSWRFFKEVGPSPRIMVPSGDGWSEAWPPVQHRSLGQRLLGLIHSPDWNERLFLHSLAERLLADPSDRTETLFRARLAAHLGVPVKGIVFRIDLIWREAGQLQSEVAYAP